MDVMLLLKVVYKIDIPEKIPEFYKKIAERFITEITPI